MSCYEWRPSRKGDPLPATAVLAGKTANDGPNYVCRNRGECGKVNLNGAKLNNFWCHHHGRSDVGDVLCLLEGFAASWEYKTRDDSVPDGAVLAGSNPSDGDNYACRSGGGAGKVNLKNGRINNFWVHGNWFAKGDGDILCVRPKHGGPSPQPTPSPTAPPQEHHEEPSPLGHWNPEADCDGVLAEARMRWLMDNHGESMDDAKGHVMREFPSVFCGGRDHWDPKVDCDGSSAEARMRWLMDNKGMSMHDAKGQIMREFPSVFREGHGKDWWEAGANCDGLPASDRARWMMENEGYSEHAARVRIRTEFPKNFRGGGDHINHGKFPHCLSLVDTPEGPRLRIEVVCNAQDVGLVAVHYQVNDGVQMNFDLRHPEKGSKTYSHVTPSGGGNPLCRNGDRVSYWLAAEINGLLSEEPDGAGPNPASRMHWTAHH